MSAPTQTMTADDVRDLSNHVRMFGGGAIVRKSGRGWWVSFRGFGCPSPFKTKGAAVEWASRWPAAIQQSARVESGVR